MFGKDKVAMIVAEFVGTAVLASVALAMLERTSFPFFLGAAMGTTYAVFWWVFGRGTGAVFNPAISLGQWTLRRVTTLQAVVAIVCQVVGGFVAWRFVEYLQHSALNNIAGKNFDWHDWRVFVA